MACRVLSVWRVASRVRRIMPLSRCDEWCAGYNGLRRVACRVRLILLSSRYGKWCAWRYWCGLCGSGRGRSDKWMGTRGERAGKSRG